MGEKKRRVKRYSLYEGRGRVKRYSLYDDFFSDIFSILGQAGGFGGLLVSVLAGFHQLFWRGFIEFCLV